MIATCANKMYTFYPSASPIGLGAEITNQRGSSTVPCVQHSNCYDPSYAPMLVAMLVAMLMTIAGRSPLGYRVVPRPTLFRVSLCSPESYR